MHKLSNSQLMISLILLVSATCTLAPTQITAKTVLTVTESDEEGQGDQVIIDMERDPTNFEIRYSFFLQGSEGKDPIGNRRFITDRELKKFRDDCQWSARWRNWLKRGSTTLSLGSFSWLLWKDWRKHRDPVSNEAHEMHGVGSFDHVQYDRPNRPTQQTGFLLSTARILNFESFFGMSFAVTGASYLSAYLSAKRFEKTAKWIDSIRKAGSSGKDTTLEVGHLQDFLLDISPVLQNPLTH